MTSPRPPAQPKSILRGHKAQVHSTTFLRYSQRLASGDADGFVVLWDLTIMRPRAVWRAHQGAILGIAGWGDDKIITHGRDNKLIVWKLAADDEATLSTALPLDHAVVSDSERPKPWVLHVLEVNTMNFCSFSSCSAGPGPVSDELLIAVPNTLSSESVDIYHLPTQTRRHTVQFASKAAKIGMAMALSLFWLEGGALTLAAAFENGHAMVARMRSSGSWDVVYKAQPHSQPILSLDVAPDKTYFLTSSADAIIAKHAVPSPNAKPSARGKPAVEKAQHSQTDTKADSTPPPAPTTSASVSTPSGAGISLLSAALTAESSNKNNNSSPYPATPRARAEAPTGPVKTTNTKHAGQQGLAVRRGDGKIFATAGWDGRVRVYSCKTLAELAVLRWHDVGCYAVAFADVGAEGEGEGGAGAEAEDRERRGGGAVVPSGELSVRERRIKMAQETHWLAAGSKDGRISLWDIY